MAAVKRKIRVGARTLAARLAPTAMESISEVPALRRQVRELRRRVATLETEVQEQRRLNRRVAELTDVIEQVLLPAADRDDERLREALEKYAGSL